MAKNKSRKWLLKAVLRSPRRWQREEREKKNIVRCSRHQSECCSRASCSSPAFHFHIKRNKEQRWSQTLCFPFTIGWFWCCYRPPRLASLSNNLKPMAPHLNVMDKGFHLSTEQDCVLTHFVIPVPPRNFFLKGVFWANAGSWFCSQESSRCEPQWDVHHCAAALRPLYFFKSFTQLLATRQLERHGRNCPGLQPHCLLAYEFLSAQQSERTLCAHTGQEQRKLST